MVRIVSPAPASNALSFHQFVKEPHILQRCDEKAGDPGSYLVMGGRLVTSVIEGDRHKIIFVQIQDYCDLHDVILKLISEIEANIHITATRLGLFFGGLIHVVAIHQLPSDDSDDISISFLHTH